MSLSLKKLGNLQEGLTVDELDKAIYRYYDMIRTSSEHPATVKKDVNPYCQMVADKIGKSDNRVRKAIDRFEFKRDNAEFTKNKEGGGMASAPFDEK